jgi:P27 family predicted phage terminase small subunit
VNESEAVVPVALPDPPPHLSAAARALWEETAPLLRDAGLITRLDRDALSALCACSALALDAYAEMRASGCLVRGPGGTVVPSPLVGIAARAVRHARLWATEFGMTPSSRRRVEPAPPEDDDAATFARYLAEGGHVQPD